MNWFIQHLALKSTEGAHIVGSPPEVRSPQLHPCLSVFIRAFCSPLKNRNFP
jgi:hypothetical protein